MSTTTNTFTLLVRKEDSTSIDVENNGKPAEMIIDTGCASWVSPVHFEHKGNSELRISVDLRKANKAVIRERFPIPRIQELLRQLSGAKMFSTLDLREAYWQIHLSEGSREITSFKPAGKVYQFKRLPFGLASAPEA